MGDLSGWVRQLPPGLDTLVAVVAYLNELGFNVSWGRLGDRWGVRTGDQSLYVGDSEGDVHGFLYGMAAAHALLEANRRVTLPRSATGPSSVYGEPLPADGRWPSEGRR